ncbi:unnamed protein product [Phytomonas sp. Hart1]|nr:unnamed protein product [Phytomonas sp. Hart1]|eukprot:CCW66700.1 unnamed protein product [Phytomonas sp. isolate Hart1]
MNVRGGDEKQSGTTDPLPHFASKKNVSIRKRFLPTFMYEYGRSVYGGNPLLQQTLPAPFVPTHPVLYIVLFLCSAILFLSMGTIILVKSSKSHVVEEYYSQIHRYQYTPSDPMVNINEGLRSFVVDGVTYKQGTMTQLRFNVKKEMKAPVYMYYKIDNLFQNHRYFKTGRSRSQLSGSINPGEMSNCHPYLKPGGVNKSGEDVIVSYDGQERRAYSFQYNPCGIAAWSMFNDTLSLFKVMHSTSTAPNNVPISKSSSTSNLNVQLLCNGTDFDAKGNPLGKSVTQNGCSKKGISWRSDTEVKFKNLTVGERWWSLYFPYTTNNTYLNKGWYLNEPGHSLPDPLDLDFQVWMRDAVLPNFRKLYRIINVDLTPGTYLLQVEEFFDVETFGGQKGFVLRPHGLGGVEEFGVGIAFLIVGSLSFVLSISYLVDCILRKEKKDAVSMLKEPRRSWYHYDPSAPEFEKYYQLLIERSVPIEELIALRKMQDPRSRSTTSKDTE